MAMAADARGSTSMIVTLSIRRVFVANQRWWPSHSARRSDGGVFDAIALRAALTRLQPEPVEPVRPQGEEVRGVTHRGEARLAEQLHRDGATVAREVEAHRLRAPREIRDDEDGLLTVLADEGEHARVDGVEELDRAPPEGAAALPHRDELLHRVEQRGRLLGLRLHVDRLVAVDGVGDDRQAKRALTGGRETGAWGPCPLHGGAHAVPGAQMEVLAPAALLAGVEDRSSRQREEPAVE